MISGFGVTVGIAWMVGALSVVTMVYVLLPLKAKQYIAEFISNIE